MIELIEKIKLFFLKYEQKIVLTIGFVLVSAISFEFGVLQGQKWQSKPLIIEKPVQSPEQGQSSQSEASVASTAKAGASSPVQTGQNPSVGNCAFVGSKNSTKFYVPTCTWAKRIKPENMVCYKSEQEAIAKGKSKSDCK